MKKVVILLLCFILILPLNVLALADDYSSSETIELVSPRYKEVQTIYMSLTISDSGRAECYTNVQIAEDYTVELEVKLQKLDGKWTDVHTWTTTGEESITIDEPWYGVRGYDYRLRITATVHDQYGNFIEAPFEYSNIVEFY